MQEEFKADFSVFIEVPRLDKLLSECYPQFSRAQHQEWIKDGMVHIDKLPAKAAQRLKTHSEIRIRARLPLRSSAVPALIELNIVYEDDFLIIINKPAGLVMHPGAGTKNDTLLNALLAKNPAQQYLPRAGIVHRLDKGTSGLIIVAKKNETLLRLQEQLRQRKIQRHYQALVVGVPISGGTVDKPLGRDPQDRLKFKAFAAKTPTTRHAVTHYRIRTKYQVHSLLNIFLETGRTHQIRCHLALLGYPIVGDFLYGARRRIPPQASQELIGALHEMRHPALHSRFLAFTHPQNQKEVRFTAPLPTDMQRLTELLTVASYIKGSAANERDGEIRTKIHHRLRR